MAYLQRDVSHLSGDLPGRAGAKHQSQLPEEVFLEAMSP